MPHSDPIRETRPRVSNNASGNSISWRQWFQICVLVLTLAIGLQFLIYVIQASGSGPITVQRPAGVEGFLPIGALMGWKLFASTGIWDPVHPAAMVILGFAFLVSLLLRKSFCGWFCPVGTVSEWLWRAGERLMGRNFLPPIWIDAPLRVLKYALMGFFVWIIFSMPPPAILAFLKSPYYQVSDVKMLFFFTRMTTLTAIVLSVLGIGSLFIRNFWCRYLCPYGALMGLAAIISPTRVKRRSETCIDCRQCSRVCPAYLPVHRKDRIVSAECSGCMDCVKSCPVPDTLNFSTAFSFRGLHPRVWSTTALGTVIVLVFCVLVYTARVTGHWQTDITPPQFRMRLLTIDSPEVTHPRMNLGK